MVLRFTLVRYRPDSLRDECRNIGLVAWGEDSWADRLVEGLPTELAGYARRRVDELREEVEALSPEARTDQAANAAILERFDGPYAAVHFKHEMGSSILLDAEEEMPQLWEWFFARHPGDSPYGRWVWHEGPQEFAGTFIVQT